MNLRERLRRSVGTTRVTESERRVSLRWKDANTLNANLGERSRHSMSSFPLSRRRRNPMMTVKSSGKSQDACLMLFNADGGYKDGGYAHM
jgi:hypothetical protein